MTDSWSSRRRAAAWVNVALQVLALLALLVVANLVARKHDRRFDLTFRRAYALHNLTEDVLRRLDADIEVFAVMPDYLMGTTQDKSVPVAWKRTLDTLEEFKKRTKRITLTAVGEQDREAQVRMQKHWTSVSSGSICIVATIGAGAGAKSNKKAIGLHQMYEGNPSTGELRAYQGEAVLLQALREITISTRRVIYQTEGHQEILTDDPRGLGFLAQFLASNEGVEFRKFEAAAGRGVPADCDLLMIAGPGQQFVAPEVQVIRDYLERGGSLFVAVKPRVKTGLEGLLEEYGAKIGDNVVHDIDNHFDGRASNLRVIEFHDHEINRITLNNYVMMPEACTVDPVEKGGKGWSVTGLARSGARSWGETGELGPNQQPRPGPDDRTGGKLPLVVAIEKPVGDAKASSPRKSKILVWGSASALTTTVVQRRELETQYIMNSFRWLMDREALEIPPIQVKSTPLVMSPQALERLKWVCVAGFPLLGVVLGLLAWFFRRK